MLNRPSGIVFDADKYLFIVDYGNNRIIGLAPNGFRCLVGCSNSPGSASNQLNSSRTLSFDSYGNIFVTDWSNRRIEKFIFLNNTLAPSYKQPKFSSNGSWNSNASTFANSSIVGDNATGIFVNTNNTVFVADQANSQIQIWLNNSVSTTRIISGNLVQPVSIFVTIYGSI